MIPRYKLVSNLSEYKKALYEFGYPEEKVCIKPMNAHGGLGFKVIANVRDVAKIVFKQQYSNIMTSDELERVLSIAFEQPFILMEYLPGTEYSVDLFARNAELIVAIPRKRDRVSNGIVIKGKIEKNDLLIQASKSIVEKLNLDSFINLQFRFDENGNPKLIDLNPRFCGSQIMSLGAGVNFPYICVKIAMGENVDIITPNWNVGMSRYWESHFYEIES
jgi:carbamoyl-phosphate synthase large subunit